MTPRHALARILLAASAFVALTAMTPVTPKNAELVYPKGGYSVTLPEGWQFDKNLGHVLVTRLGPGLQAIQVFRREHKKAYEELKVVTKPDESIEQLGEYLVASFKKANNTIEILQTAPAEIGGREAARVDWRMKSASGVAHRATTYVFVTEKYLYEVQFKATEQVYWDMDRPAFDAFLASFKLLPAKD